MASTSSSSVKPARRSISILGSLIVGRHAQALEHVVLGAPPVLPADGHLQVVEPMGGVELELAVVDLLEPARAARGESLLGDAPLVAGRVLRAGLGRAREQAVHRGPP